MTDFQTISNSQFFGNSVVTDLDPWVTKSSSSGLWETSSSSTNHTVPSSFKSSNGMQQPPTNTHYYNKNFDPQKVPSSIKNSKFINISNTQSSIDPWLQTSSEVAIAPKRKSLKSYSSDDNIPPPSAQLQQLLQQQQQQQQQQLPQQPLQQQQQQDDELDPDIEEEISGQSRYKTELCRSFAETGVCRYGFKCQFAHGKDELRPVMRHPKYKTETCKTFHTLGSCPYGSRCRFIHSNLPLPDLNAEQNNYLDQQQQQQQNSLSTSSSSISPPLQQQQQLQPSPPQQSQPLQQVPLQQSQTLSPPPPQLQQQHQQLPQQPQQQQQQQQTIPHHIQQAFLLQQQQQQNSPFSQPTNNTNLPLHQSQPIFKPVVNWTNSWSDDNSTATSSTTSTNLLKTSLPIMKPKEDNASTRDSKRRLAIFKTICSTNPSWN
eukprot:gene6073-7565_t